MPSAALEHFGRLTGCPVHPPGAYEQRTWSAQADTREVCAGCAAPCCTSYVVPVSVVDAHRLRTALGLDYRRLLRFEPYRADAPTWWVRLDGARWQLALRRRGRRCSLVRRVRGQLLCRAHAARPMSCRVFPLLTPAISARRAPAGMLPQLPPSACPRAWPATDAARAALTALAQDEARERALDQQVLRIWSQQLNVPHRAPDFFAFLDEILPRALAGDCSAGPWRTRLW